MRFQWLIMVYNFVSYMRRIFLYMFHSLWHRWRMLVMFRLTITDINISIIWQNFAYNCDIAIIITRNKVKTSRELIYGEIKCFNKKIFILFYNRFCPRTKYWVRLRLKEAIVNNSYITVTTQLYTIVQLLSVARRKIAYIIIFRTIA